ncbi:heterokaryon incompatibility protein-domain-containing protein [Hypoxylon rubiginosum]|uniref:Heterokaryon incompatibility protein-domain-containing protein n=1 Tax=Hypoxylon rubiginosum TaxID=110542 RepID=A0ACC0CT25_9PEZI|nr:heterokaryon incompatibility protein-domain-containing protein [Hypoxylon rubiginosum]
MYTFGYEPFTYSSSLTLRRIRLIKILPPTRSLWPPFRMIPRVQLLEYDLDPSGDDPIPAYDALSYTWDVHKGEEPSWPILIETAADDGPRQLLIHKNLFLALQSLWSSRELLTPLRPVFADQICINQQDIPERSFAVGLMGELYSRCARVIVWLGPATAKSNALFEAARAIGSEAAVKALLSTPPPERLRVTEAVIHRTCDPDDELLRAVDRYGPGFPVAGYAEVLQRTWFTRLWIIQEASLAPSGMFLCGDQTLEFDDFRALFYFHSVVLRIWSENRKVAVSVSEIALRDSIPRLEKPFVRIFGERMAIHRTNTRLSLFDLVKKYNVNREWDKIGATNAEDRVLGLLGLADSTLKAEVGNPRGVYIKIAEESIRRGDVDILCYSQRPKCVDDLPSWVPDWSMPQLDDPRGYNTQIVNWQPNASSVALPMYKAGGKFLSKNFEVTPDGTLCIPGVVVGSVAEVGKYEIKLLSEDTFILSDLDYVDRHDLESLSKFFEEIDSFLEKASKIPGAYNQYSESEDGRLQASLALSDGGLTARQFPDSDHPDPQSPPLKQLYDELRGFADVLVKVREAAVTYSSISRTYNKHRPPPAGWARTSPILYKLQLTFAALEATLAVALFRIHSLLRPLRRWLAGIPPALKEGPDPNGLSNMDLHRTKKMFEYRSNLFLNHKRKLYLTDGGLVGLGPTDMAAGDIVVVIPGGNMPHIVRPKSSAAQGPDGGLGNGSSADQDKLTLDCTYIGESYCHGIMDGEVMTAGVQECILRIS